MDWEGVADERSQNGGKNVGCANADDDADETSQQSVTGTLANELLDQLEAALPHSARHSHLGTALGCKHGEDQDDQQNAGGDRKEAEDDEDAGEGGADAFRGIEEVGFGIRDTESSALQERSDLILGGNQLVLGLFDGTNQADRYVIDHALLTQELLGLGKGDGDSGVVGFAGIVVVDFTDKKAIVGYASDSYCRGLAPDIERELVSNLEAQIFGQILADDHGSGCKRGNIDCASVD